MVYHALIAYVESRGENVPPLMRDISGFSIGENYEFDTALREYGEKVSAYDRQRQESEDDPPYDDDAAYDVVVKAEEALETIIDMRTSWLMLRLLQEAGLNLL